MVPSLEGLASFQIAYVVDSLELTTSEMEAAGHPAVARIHRSAKPATARPRTTTRRKRSDSSSKRWSHPLECREPTSRPDNRWSNRAFSARLAQAATQPPGRCGHRPTSRRTSSSDGRRHVRPADRRSRPRPSRPGAQRQDAPAKPNREARHPDPAVTNRLEARKSRTGQWTVTRAARSAPAPPPRSRAPPGRSASSCSTPLELGRRRGC
jgi:hypothetical protein